MALVVNGYVSVVGVVQRDFHWESYPHVCKLLH